MAASLCCYVAVRLCSYVAAKLCGYIAMWQHNSVVGWLADWLVGWLAAWLPACLSACLLDIQKENKITPLIRSIKLTFQRNVQYGGRHPTQSRKTYFQDIRSSMRIHRKRVLLGV